MKNWIYLLTLLVLGTSCTQIDVDENLPDWKKLSPTEIETNLPVINIDAAPADLNLIFTNYNYPYLVDAKVTYYNEQKELLFEKEAIIEIKGAGSASEPMKPIGIRLNSPVNNQELQIINPTKVNSTDDLTFIQSIRLRNSGQDYGFTMIKDLAYTEFALRAGLELSLKYGKPAHVFFNSEYYGLHNIRTENDLMALGQLYHVDTASITLLKMDNGNHNLEFKAGDEAFAENFIAAIKHHDYPVIIQSLDMTDFMDYIIFEDYAGNYDWPHNNARAYRIDGGKFRFMLFDLDLVGVRSKNQILPEMEYLDDHISRIYQILLEQHPNFEETFHIRQEYWYKRFSPAMFNQIVDELAKDIENDMPYLISRRNIPESTLKWKLNLDQLKRDFERTDHFNRKKYQL
jgi:hypothetical protein